MIHYPTKTTHYPTKPIRYSQNYKLHFSQHFFSELLLKVEVIKKKQRYKMHLRIILISLYIWSNLSVRNVSFHNLELYPKATKCLQSYYCETFSSAVFTFSPLGQDLLSPTTFCCTLTLVSTFCTIRENISASL